MASEKTKASNSWGPWSNSGAMDPDVRASSNADLSPTRTMGHLQSTLDISGDNDESIIYIQGLRFWGIVTSIALLFFLTTIDITIATTSLVAITGDIGHFEMASWILTSYQVGYAAIIVIFAKISDLIGRKPVFLACIATFTLFSAGCAAAKTTTQLIVLRAFQGIGAGGCFTLGVTVLFEAVPPNEYPSVVAKVGLSAILAMVLGPILGGAISENTTWRWIFIINAPIGVLVFIVAVISIPNGFPYQGRRSNEAKKISLNVIRDKIDLPGSILLVFASLSFTACFQEAGARFSWNSAYVITLLILSIVFWICLMLWERFVTLASRTTEPVLPWRLFTNRLAVGTLFSFLFIGIPLSVAYFQLPQRFQLVNGLSSLDAGVRVLPFGAASSSAVVLSGRVASKVKIPAIYFLLFGAILQTVGFALLSTLKAATSIAPATYGYMVIAGTGCGLCYSTALLVVPITTEKRDQAVAMGVANQFRVMGGAFGLAIATAVFNGHVRSQFTRLGISIPITDLAAVARLSLQPAIESEVRKVLSDGYNYQMVVLSAFGAAQLPAALLLWKHNQIITS